MGRTLNLLILSLFLSLSSFAQSDTKDYWPEITNEAKPWTRWWWMGSAVDQENIIRLMNQYAEKGIGGVEITPIYGVKGEEKNYLSFLSPEWVDMLNVTVEAAHEYGMGVDMNTGTGWPFGGPTITREFAAKKMTFHSLGNLSQEMIQQFIMEKEKNSQEELIALSACNNNERINLLEEGNSLDDIDQNNRQVFAVTQQNTEQKVKRAAPGGEGLVFNHFSEDATKHYLKRFDEVFKGNPGVRCFFNDSYELSNANSVAELFNTFKAIKGYDLALYTKEMSGQGSNKDIARIKADYRDVLGEMLLQNFTNTWANWAEKYGALTKNQAHGSPGNLIDLYAAIGIPEMETFHASNFPFLQEFMTQSDAKHTESNHLFKKFASSAAHMKGEKLVSCETFTWLNEHFKTPFYQCKPELDELFVKGVTHLFFHGTAYSPKRAEWPGWLFYASSHIEPNNPQWEHLGAMNEYIARCQSVLQQGRHTNDFLVYWSPDNYNHDAERLAKKLTLHNSESWVKMPEIDVLLEKGYQFDFTTDRIISSASVISKNVVTYDKVDYKTIVVPDLSRIKLTTLKNLLKLADQGATIVFSNMPLSVSGFNKYQEKEIKLAALVRALKFSNNDNFKIAAKGDGIIYVGNIEAALNDIGIKRETLIDFNIKNISRKTEKGIFYFIANHEKEELNDWLMFKNNARNALSMNPMTGDVRVVESDSGKVHIELAPGASTIIYFTNENIDGIKKYPYKQVRKVYQLSNSWKLRALKGGPELFSETTLDELKYWTDLPDEEPKYFAGTCEYSTRFTINEPVSDKYLLHFECVEASAKIFVNNHEVATLWCFPFEVNIGEFLKEGENTLRIEVCNLGSNRLRYLDRQGVEWKKFHDINIVNLDYKPLDATKWEVLPSGLSGKVELIQLK